MAERYLELHSEYRNRYILFYLADGTVTDSREINWRRVEWERVVKLEAWLKGRCHKVECDHVAFRFFLNFKESEYGIDMAGTYRRTDSWIIGWTDGETAHLQRIDFKSGKLVREYTQPLSQLAAHIHPRVQGMVAGQQPGTYTQEQLGY